MTKIYLWSKKIHRTLVIAIIFLAIIMIGTGTLLKYSVIVGEISFIDLELARYIHNSLSIWFAIILSPMIITGTIMYVYPWWM